MYFLLLLLKMKVIQIRKRKYEGAIGIETITF